MPSVMDLVTIRCARMNTVLLHALVRRFCDLVRCHRLRCGHIVRVSDRGRERGRGQHGGREQNGRNFPVHSSFFLWALVN